MTRKNNNMMVAMNVYVTNEYATIPFAGMEIKESFTDRGRKMQRAISQLRRRHLYEAADVLEKKFSEDFNNLRSYVLFIGDRAIIKSDGNKEKVWQIAKEINKEISRGNTMISISKILRRIDINEFCVMRDGKHAGMITIGR